LLRLGKITEPKMGTESDDLEGAMTVRLAKKGECLVVEALGDGIEELLLGLGMIE